MRTRQIINALIDIYSEALKYCKDKKIDKGICYAAEKLQHGEGATLFNLIHNKYGMIGYICKCALDCRDSIEIKYTLRERLKVLEQL